MPSDQQQLKDLCEQLLACEDDDTAVTKAEELRAALHRHIEELRRKLKKLHARAS